MRVRLPFFSCFFLLLFCVLVCLGEGRDVVCLLCFWAQRHGMACVPAWPGEKLKIETVKQSFCVQHDIALRSKAFCLAFGKVLLLLSWFICCFCWRVCALSDKFSHENHSSVGIAQPTGTVCDGPTWLSRVTQLFSAVCGYALHVIYYVVFIQWRDRKIYTHGYYFSREYSQYKRIQRISGTAVLLFFLLADVMTAIHS